MYIFPTFDRNHQLLVDTNLNIDGVVQNCSNSIANALE